MQKIILSKTDIEILTKHAEDEKPNEACAILLGKGDTVSEAFLTKNIAESPVNFTISNKQLLEVYKKAEESNTAVIGIFHSHPRSQAYPSNTDKKIMNSNPVVWIIYSGSDKNMKAYVLNSDIEEIPIQES